MNDISNRFFASANIEDEEIKMCARLSEWVCSFAITFFSTGLAVEFSMITLR